MAEDKKKDGRLVVLEDGRELRVNLNTLTWREVRELMSGINLRDEETREQSERRYAELVGQAVGLNADEMLALGYVDFRKVEKKVADFVRDPVGTDPN